MGKINTDREKINTDREKINTDREKINTDREKMNTDRERLRQIGKKCTQIALTYGILIGIIFKVYAQPNIPKENIPFYLDPEVKAQMEELYSDEPQERAFAVKKLAAMEEKAMVAIPYLIEMLVDTGRLKPYGFVSSEAVEALAKIGKPAVEPLITVLKSKNQRMMKINAILALNKIKDFRAIGPLMEIFSNQDERLRLYAQEAVGELGADAIKYLRAALGDTNELIRASAAGALGYIAAHKKEPRAIEPLIVALKDTNVTVRRSAAMYLYYVSTSLHKDKSLVEPLIAALYDTDLETIGYAAIALGNIKDNRAIQPLIETLRYERRGELSPDTLSPEAAHLNAVYALAKIGNPAVKYLKEALGVDNVNIRQGAACALGLIKDISAVRPLVFLLSDTSEKVRVQAAEALKEIGKPAIEQLIFLFKNGDKRANDLAQEALKKITGKDFGQDYTDWRVWWEANK